MKNTDLIEFAKAWRDIWRPAQDMIEDIVYAPQLSSALLERLDIELLKNALEELRCCNVPDLVRLLDEACEEALCYQSENKI